MTITLILVIFFCFMWGRKEWMPAALFVSIVSGFVFGTVVALVMIFGAIAAFIGGIA